MSACCFEFFPLRAGLDPVTGFLRQAAVVFSNHLVSYRVAGAFLSQYAAQHPTVEPDLDRREPRRAVSDDRPSYQELDHSVVQQTLHDAAFAVTVSDEELGRGAFGVVRHGVGAATGLGARGVWAATCGSGILQRQHELLAVKTALSSRTTASMMEREVLLHARVTSVAEECRRTGQNLPSAPEKELPATGARYIVRLLARNIQLLRADGSDFPVSFGGGKAFAMEMCNGRTVRGSGTVYTEG